MSIPKLSETERIGYAMLGVPIPSDDDLVRAARARDGALNALLNTREELSALRIKSAQLGAALDSVLTLAQSAPNQLKTKMGREDYADELRRSVGLAIELGVRIGSAS